jgi:hypothetical protein
MGCGGAIAGAGFRVLPDLNNLRKKLSGLSDDSDKPEELDTTEVTSESLDATEGMDTFEKTALEGLDPTALEGLDPTEGIDTFDKTALDPTDGLDVSEKTDWFNVGSGGAMRAGIAALAALANLDFCL